jgi:hypothetical protein
MLWDIQMHWYDMHQFCLLNIKVSMLGIANENIYISKSFCVSEFGKVEVTPAESSFLGPLHC